MRKEVENCIINRRELVKPSISTSVSEKSITGATLQGRTNKGWVILTAIERKELKWLFTQANQLVPNWLRCELKVNRRRRKLLNGAIREAGLDDIWCEHCHDDNDWSTQLHSVWHKINRGMA